MKKLLVLAALASVSALTAQTTTTTTTTTMPDGDTKTATMTSQYDRKFTLSVYGSFIELNQAGLSLEFLGQKETKSKGDKSLSYYFSKIVNVAYGMMNYEAGGLDVDGNGFVIDLGQRTYFMGKNSGLYLGNYISYGNFRFDDNVSAGPITANFKGTYQYFSLFSPEIGFKIMAGPVAIDPFAGVMWKLEIKGKGDVDNRNVEEWTPRVGLKIGYQF